MLQCSDDVIAPDVVGEYVHREIPGSTYRHLAATGHCPNLSAPEETIDGDPELRLTSQSVEELYENAPCGYLSTAPDGRIVRVNATFERWTGYAREDLVGVKRFQDLLTAGGRIYHETHYAPLLRMQGSVREIAVDIVTADGRRLPVLVNSVLVTDDDGRAAGGAHDAVRRDRAQGLRARAGRGARGSCGTSRSRCSTA